MLRTRLWMGAILIGFGVVLLTEDRWAAPYFPIFACAVCAAVVAGVRELRQMLPESARPRSGLAESAVVSCVAVGWLPLAATGGADGRVLVGAVVSAAFMAAILIEMYCYRSPGGITIRLGVTMFAVLYLGMLPAFLVAVRFLPADVSTAALTAAIFIPKFCDIGAYFTGKFLTGRLLGRHPMTPRLSPKKTWQGLIGGLLAAVSTALVINSLTGFPGRGPGFAAVLGLAVGIAGVLGDLAESLIKRDLETKDASQTVPGFGGVLDVIDSLLFAAPVVWLFAVYGR